MEIKVEVRVDGNEVGRTVKASVTMSEERGYGNAPAISQGHIDKALASATKLLKQAADGL